MVRKGQPTVNITKVDIETEFAGEQQLHDRIKVTCATADGGEPIVITGESSVDDSTTQSARGNSHSNRRRND